MSSFRFVPTADIHRDSPMRGLSDALRCLAGRLRLATREALTALLDAAIERAVDFRVIAGDLYDGDWRDYQTGVFFVGQMHRLAAASIPVYLIHGNRDAQNQMTRSLSLPDNVGMFSFDAPETKTTGEFDERDELKIVDVRSDGPGVAPIGMSEGTRDRLYPARRIAAIEDYRGRATPPPAVADDLFINFDNQRDMTAERLDERAHTHDL